MPMLSKILLSSHGRIRLWNMMLTLFKYLPILAFLYFSMITLSAAADVKVNRYSHEDFQQVLDSLQKLYGFPGATAAYILRDGTKGVVATGLADVEAGTVMTIQSRMLAASIGKTFVGATVFTPEDLITFVLDMPPLFKAGDGWSYSDTGYVLLGLVIESATRRSYYEEILERFIAPLELNLTSPSDRRLLPGLVAGYMSSENDFGFPEKTLNANGLLNWHPGFEWTGGGLVSNSLDLAKWGEALFGGAAMSGNYLQELLRGVSVSHHDDNIFYGAGVGIYRSGPFGRVYGHGGWIPGYSSSLRHYPDYGVTIAFQINTDIGIVEDSTALVSEMEARLASIAISISNNKHESPKQNIQGATN